MSVTLIYIILCPRWDKVVPSCLLLSFVSTPLLVHWCNRWGHDIDNEAFSTLHYLKWPKWKGFQGQNELVEYKMSFKHYYSVRQSSEWATLSASRAYVLSQPFISRAGGSDVFLGERSGDEMLPSAVAQSWDYYHQIALLSDVRATIDY